jgi:hypothetical protein
VYRSVTGPTYGATVGQVLDKLVEQLLATYLTEPGVDDATIHQVTQTSGPTAPWETCSSGGEFTIEFIATEGNQSGNIRTFGVTIVRWSTDCVGDSDPDVNNPEVCTSSAPLMDFKEPPDGKLVLLKQPDGTLVPSIFEPDEDIPTRFRDPNRSQVNLCLESDLDRRMQLAPAKQGGFMIYETGSGGAPVDNALIRLYGSDGKLKGYGDTTAINSWSPE